MSINILTVDDDVNIRKLVRLYLVKEGYRVLEASDGEEALMVLEAEKVDLMILDLMMPRLDGWELAESVKKYMDIPIIMISAKGESRDKIKGFQLGTDDYLVKPFDPVELVMRVKALLKRYNIATSQVIQFQDVVIDRNNYEVRINGNEMKLPLKEFELIFRLASNPGQIFTRDQLIEQIWGINYEGDERTVDVHIKRLRERFAHVADVFRIATVRGLGYRLEVNK